MMVSLTRRYEFSASHRLHNPNLSEEQNARLYGKCNSAYGHGHNYRLEVTVKGPIDPATGMVMDLVKLDRVVKSEVLERFDHIYLNLDVPDFERQVPTTENLCIRVYDLLRGHVANSDGLPVLERVRLEETRSNFFEYEGKGQETEVRSKEQEARRQE